MGGGRSPILALPPASAHALGAFYHHVRAFLLYVSPHVGPFHHVGVFMLLFYIYLVDHFCPYRGPFFGITNPPNENFLGHRCLPMLPYAGAHVSHLRGPMHAHTKYMYLLISIFGIYRILYGK